jgi:hypothetical protein
VDSRRWRDKRKRYGNALERNQKLLTRRRLGPALYAASPSARWPAHFGLYAAIAIAWHVPPEIICLGQRIGRPLNTLSQQNTRGNGDIVRSTPPFGNRDHEPTPRRLLSTLSSLKGPGAQASLVSVFLDYLHTIDLDAPLSTVHCLLSTVYRPLSTVHCLLSTIHDQRATKSQSV